MKVQAVGECMVEIVRTRTGGALLGYGGDTYNTAVYLARVAAQLGVQVHAEFVTGLGGDPESQLMRERWARDGVADGALVVADGGTGAYLVTTDEEGERSFSYWREGSAAARILAGVDWVERLDADHVYLSGVSLQLMSEESREALVSRLDWLRRRGTTVTFDSNFRPSGWATAEAAAAAMASVLRVCDTALVTLEDEIALGVCCDVPTCAKRLELLGVTETVVKVGGQGSWVQADGVLTHAPTRQLRAIDTTGAGDSFNGAYLAARIGGMPALQAAQLGNIVAGYVVTQPGAVVNPAAMPALAP